MREIRLAVLLIVTATACTAVRSEQSPNSAKLDAAHNIVAAVNNKSSEMYVRDLALDVER